MRNSNKNKPLQYFFTIVFVAFLASSLPTQSAQAQEVTVTPGVDLYSTYVWRGVAYSGPSIQPYVELGAGGFALGAWGSQGIDGSFTDGSNGFQEMDLYTSYTFDFGLSLGVTDYYYPGTLYFEENSHAFELNGGYSIGNLSLSANYIFAGEGSVGDDVYFQAGYSAGPASLFVGGGDGWHVDTPEDGFQIVNVGVATSKEIPITDDFSLPVSGSVILNPDTEQLYILAGISL
jgi:hypothetical protein